jgi:hypothetical protein
MTEDMSSKRAVTALASGEGGRAGDRFTRLDDLQSPPELIAQGSLVRSRPLLVSR